MPFSPGEQIIIVGTFVPQNVGTTWTTDTNRFLQFHIFSTFFKHMVVCVSGLELSEPSPYTDSKMPIFAFLTISLIWNQYTTDPICVPPCQTARSQQLQPSSNDIKRLFWKIQTRVERRELFLLYKRAHTLLSQVLGTLWSGLISLIGPMCVLLTSCTLLFYWLGLFCSLSKIVLKYVYIYVCTYVCVCWTFPSAKHE